MNVVAFSGGKDSTAMALRLYVMGVEFKLLHTATGNELPDVRQHIKAVQARVGAELIDLAAPTLEELILQQKCLPNWRMRWCTRMIKIEPVLRWLQDNPGITLHVGLRADEETREGGAYGNLAQIRYPLREWCWGLNEVVECCSRHNLSPPARTDCAVCFYQTLGEWYQLWKNYPEEYTLGEKWEELTGHTFRSPQRDSRPAALRDLRVEFENGYAPKVRRRKTMCRVCAL